MKTYLIEINKKTEAKSQKEGKKEIKDYKQLVYIKTHKLNKYF